MDFRSAANTSEMALKRVLAEEHASVLSGLTSQTIVITRDGETPIEWLNSGDEVLTRDRGFEPVIWVNRVKLNRAELRDFPEFIPVKVKAGSVAKNVPATDMTVSPNQLFLIRSARAELNFGTSEVLVPAASLGQRMNPEDMRWNARVSYAQVLLASHQVLLAENLWSGSLFTVQLGLGLDEMGCALAVQLDQLYMQASRPILSEVEGKALMREVWLDQAVQEADDMGAAKAG